MNADWLDERIRLGEIPETSAAKARERLATDEGRAAQASLALSDASILERLPPERIAARIRTRREAKAVRSLFLWNSPGLSVLAAACFAFCAVMAPRVADRAFSPDTTAVAAGAEVAPSPTSAAPTVARERPAADAPAAEARKPVVVAEAPVSDDGIRVRGGQGLSLFSVAPDGSTLPCGASTRAGSVLRVVAPLSSQAAIWSIDETGMIQRHWPVQGDSSAALASGPLPRDWETDPSAGWERFVLVESSSRFPLRAVEAHLRGLVASGRARDARLSLPGRLETSSVLVERAVR